MLFLKFLDTAGKVIHLELRERDTICEDPPGGLQEGMAHLCVRTALTFQWKHKLDLQGWAAAESDGSPNFVGILKVAMILAQTADFLVLSRDPCRDRKTWLHLPGQGRTR